MVMPGRIVERAPIQQPLPILIGRENSSPALRLELPFICEIPAKITSCAIWQRSPISIISSLSKIHLKLIKELFPILTLFVLKMQPGFILLVFMLIPYAL
jgi:hypothetical protein